MNVIIDVVVYVEDSMSGKISEKDQRFLCTQSGNRCAIPECKIQLITKKSKKNSKSNVGIMAHIKGENPGSARYDHAMSIKDRNSYENLIYVCSNCHKNIDDQPNVYTVEKLHKIKEDHEKWVLLSTEKEIPNITFSELDQVSKYLLSDQIKVSDSYVVIPPHEKIKKNQLSTSTANLITSGLIQANQVEHFIENSPDIDFGERLKHGFVEEYEKLRKKKISADNLFSHLLDFASGGSSDFKRRAAGLAVLAHLFEICEVFEK